MSGTKISGLAAASAIADADLLPIVQGGATKKATAELMRAASSSNGLTAAGAGQGDALGLTASVNRITGVGAGTGVRLPQAAVGRRVTVINKGGNALAIYPASGESINDGAANAPDTLPRFAAVEYVCGAAGTWDSMNGSAAGLPNKNVTPHGLGYGLNLRWGTFFASSKVWVLNYSTNALETSFGGWRVEGADTITLGRAENQSTIAQFTEEDGANDKNFVQLYAAKNSGAADGAGAKVKTAGTGSNIDLELLPKGSGVISARAPFKLKSYTVAGLPDAALNAQCLVYVSDGSGNRRLAISDGTSWRWPDGNTVS